jgi:hypothetical protein
MQAHDGSFESPERAPDEAAGRGGHRTSTRARCAESFRNNMLRHIAGPYNFMSVPHRLLLSSTLLARSRRVRTRLGPTVFER